MSNKSNHGMNFFLYNFPFGIRLKSYLILSIVPCKNIKVILNNMNIILMSITKIDKRSINLIICL